MDKLKTFITFLRLVGMRKPSVSYIVLALSGKAVLVHDGNGTIVLTSTAARQLAGRLENLANKAEAL